MTVAHTRHSGVFYIGSKPDLFPVCMIVLANV